MTGSYICTFFNFELRFPSNFCCQGYLPCSTDIFYMAPLRDLIEGKHLFIFETVWKKKTKKV